MEEIFSRIQLNRQKQEILEAQPGKMIKKLIEYVFLGESGIVIEVSPQFVDDLVVAMLDYYCQVLEQKNNPDNANILDIKAYLSLPVFFFQYLREQKVLPLEITVELETQFGIEYRDHLRMAFTSIDAQKLAERQGIA